MATAESRRYNMAGVHRFLNPTTAIVKRKLPIEYTLPCDFIVHLRGSICVVPSAWFMDAALRTRSAVLVVHAGNRLGAHHTSAK